MHNQYRNVYSHCVLFTSLTVSAIWPVTLGGRGGGGGLVNPVDIYVYTTIRNITIDID